jgi:hypothetical protein
LEKLDGLDTKVGLEKLRELFKSILSYSKDNYEMTLFFSELLLEPIEGF